MKKTLIITGVVATTLIGLFVVGNRGIAPQVSREQAKLASISVEDKKVTLYKSPTCGCCAIYVRYLEGLGFKVDVKDTSDMAAIKDQYGVTSDIKSCHTTVASAGKYFIEGHVAIEAVSKLLNDKPAIKGIGLFGMPSGTPGMPGSKSGDWDIQQVNGTGQTTSFMTI